jgi:hypothetical protein
MSAPPSFSFHRKYLTLFTLLGKVVKKTIEDMVEELLLVGAPGNGEAMEKGQGVEVLVSGINKHDGKRRITCSTRIS